MFIQSIHLKNFLSFGEKSGEIELGNLNVLIGANGSGKSNFLEAISLLSSAPRDIAQTISAGGGVREWLWKGGSDNPVAEVNVVFHKQPQDHNSHAPYLDHDTRYVLKFTMENRQLAIKEERIETTKPTGPHNDPFIYYIFQGKSTGKINTKVIKNGEYAHTRELTTIEIDTLLSIFSQRKDRDFYPELTYLGRELEKIRLYREWGFGRYSEIRLAQKIDLPNVHVDPYGRNLWLVLNNLFNDDLVREHIIGELKKLYKNIRNIHVHFEGGVIQLYIHEDNYSKPIEIPATRLSDGTLRYLALLAVLCHPNPPPIVCIEEPELGMHPDIIPKIADLLVEASERCQIIVTTHSADLVDSLNKTPDVVYITEKDEDGTEITRFDPEKHKHWLEEYRLGDLWAKGVLGGNP